MYDINMDTKTPTSSYHHQRAPRTPESYFNVPESIALLNIVKSERIQSAFQSNRKNHASVWEMVAEVLNRFSARKRSAKQCCNRYENLKKIYTQLKKNPERHVRRNWPYMFLFKEIEEQRGECWGSTSKRLNLLTKSAHHHNNEISYYQRRRQAVELSTLLSSNKEINAVAQHNLLQSLAHSNDSSSNASKMERFLPNHFVEAQLTEGSGDVVFDEPPAPTVNTSGSAAVAAAVVANAAALQLQQANSNSVLNAVGNNNIGGGLTIRKELQNNCNGNRINVNGPTSILEAAAAVAAAAIANGLNNRTTKENFTKDCNGALNLQTCDNNMSLKSEPLSDGEFNPDDIQLMQTNYNGSQSYYPHDINPNLLHPDVIVDTDNISSSSSVASIKSKRKLSSSTDGDSTNYELIEYLKRREKRDEELLKRMDTREERLLNLLERTVVAIETLAASHGNNKRKKSFEEKQTQIPMEEEVQQNEIKNQEKNKESNEQKNEDTPTTPVPSVQT